MFNCTYYDSRGPCLWSLVFDHLLLNRNPPRPLVVHMYQFRKSRRSRLRMTYRGQIEDPSHGIIGKVGNPDARQRLGCLDQNP